jgi:hypothetical protein
MTRRLIVILVSVLIAIAVMVAVMQRELLTPAGRNARFMRQLERGTMVVRRSCYTMEAFVEASRWTGMSASDQERAARGLAAYCAEQGGSGQMTIIDSETRSKLGYWSGTEFRRD